MSSSIWIINLVVLGAVLESDLGRRRIGPFRLLRPVATAALIVPFFLHGLATARNGVALEIAGTALGIALGGAAASLISVEYDRTRNRPFSRAGVAYALFWIAVTAARLFFAYGSQHIFGRQLGRFLSTHNISVAAVTATFVLMAISMVLTRTGALWIRANQAIVTAGRDGAAVRPSYVDTRTD